MPKVPNHLWGKTPGVIVEFLVSKLMGSIVFRLEVFGKAHFKAFQLSWWLQSKVEVRRSRSKWEESFDLRYFRQESNLSFYLRILLCMRIYIYIYIYIYGASPSAAGPLETEVVGG